jgi:hypothetical protein
VWVGWGCCCCGKAPEALPLLNEVCLLCTTSVPWRVISSPPYKPLNDWSTVLVWVQVEGKSVEALLQLVEAERNGDTVDRQLVGGGGGGRSCMQGMTLTPWTMPNDTHNCTFIIIALSNEIIITTWIINY